MRVYVYVCSFVRLSVYIYKCIYAPRMCVSFLPEPLISSVCMSVCVYPCVFWCGLDPPDPGVTSPLTFFGSYSSLILLLGDPVGSVSHCVW